MDSEQAKIYLTILIIIFIVTIIVVFFVRNGISQHKKLLQSYRSRLQTEIITLETERKRMAADLHDDLGPFLSSLKLQLNMLDVTEEDKPVVNSLNDGLSNIIQKVREISNGLLPNILTRDGIIAAIEAFAEKINATKQLVVETSIEIKKSPLLPEQEVHLFRIFQEALNNCIKHSGATTFVVKLLTENKKLVLEMKDNGKGVDLKKANEALGMGLKNILSRTDILGGEFYCDSKSGKGLEYRIEVPITEKAAAV